MAFLRSAVVYSQSESGPGVAVRIENATDKVFESVVIGFPSQREDYGSIPAGEASVYRSVARAYRYAYAEIKIDGETLVLRPIDYVGESLLRPGRYTYRITLNPKSTSRDNRIFLDLVVDK
jgi:hypothetical protein